MVRRQHHWPQASVCACVCVDGGGGGARERPERGCGQPKFIVDFTHAALCYPSTTGPWHTVEGGLASAPRGIVHCCVTMPYGNGQPKQFITRPVFSGRYAGVLRGSQQWLTTVLEQTNEVAVVPKHETPGGYFIAKSSVDYPDRIKSTFRMVSFMIPYHGPDLSAVQVCAGGP